MAAKGKTKKSAKQVQDEILANRLPIVEEIVELMKEGGQAWIAPMKAYGAPYNPVTGARYRGANRMHLVWACYKNQWKDPRFVTFNQAKAAGWNVKKGSHGVRLEFWKRVGVVREEERKAAEEAGEVTCERTFWRCVSTFVVFNAEQIEGMPEIEMPEQTDAELDALCDVIKAASPCPVVEGAGNVACYWPTEDAINIFDRRHAFSLNGFARTLLHEEVHSTGAPSRLARPMHGRFGSADYAREELIAELGAAFLAAELGLPETSDEQGREVEHAAQHAAYLANWASVLSEDPSILFSVVTEAEKAVDFIAEAWRDKPETDAEPAAA